MHLIDFDCVDLSNVNRQQYALSQIGMPKPEAMAEEIRRFSPYIEIRTSHVKITPDNFKELLDDADYICEAFDRPEEKAMLTGLVLEQMPEKYLVGASDGRISQRKSDSDQKNSSALLPVRRRHIRDFRGMGTDGAPGDDLRGTPGQYSGGADCGRNMYRVTGAAAD